MKNAIKLLPFFLLLILVATSCDEGGSGEGSNSELLPPDPRDWVCNDPIIELNQVNIEDWCMMNSDRGKPVPISLKTPHPLSRLHEKNTYDLELQAFLRDRIYAAELGWIRDMNWRLTGPYVGKIGSGLSFGVHPAVRIYYSPEIIDWLCSGRTGAIPDGAMIVKEMHGINESLDITLDIEGCMAIQADVEPDAWTVMVKTSRESHDGWYWAGFLDEPEPPLFAWQIGNPPIFDISGVTSDDFLGELLIPSEPNRLWYPTGFVFESQNKIPTVVYSFSQHGHHCINCHSTAESESTFVSFENILRPGIRYKQFKPERLLTDAPMDELLDDPIHAPGLQPVINPDEEVINFDSPFGSQHEEPLTEFLGFYNQLDLVTLSEVWNERLPAETYDHVVSKSGDKDNFITSDQCIACHNATYSNASLPNMMLEEEKGGETRLINLSPYGEWRASPMGLAGRDPIFFSQLQSETNNLPQLSACIENTCLHCHGVMGQRQLAMDTQGENDQGCKELFAIEPPPEVPFGRPFRREMVTQWPNSDNNSEQKYGALARDGISCTVCHHISNKNLGEESSYTGNFVTGPPDEVYGPYETETIASKSMENAIGIKPLFADYFVGPDAFSSDICGSCHNILLPVFDNNGKLLGASYEQATHLEWQNSDFAPGREDFKSCQDCHMPTHYKGRELSFKIANIESDEFAPTTHRLPDEEIQLLERDRYPRHSLHGLNIFLNEMFHQFPIILGFRQIDYMTGTAIVPSLITGRNSMIEMARNETASIDIEELKITGDGTTLRALVKVTNKAGHYLPSGVGFRRIFIEFLVRDRDGNILWASGRTNELGAILNGVTDEVLPSDEPLKFPEAPFQPHYQVIERGDQVQIYQELVKDSEGNLTTSFLRRVQEVKDNRLRPKGFAPGLFSNSRSPFVRELAELHGEEKFDLHYTDPELTGSDMIEYIVTLDKETIKRIDNVKVALYSQSIPPFYLQERFRDASRGPGNKNDIERLYYLTSHLNVDDVTDEQGEHILKGWKLMIANNMRRLE